MQSPKLSHTTIFLQGLSLRSWFTLTNPNEQFALNYDIQVVGRGQADQKLGEGDQRDQGEEVLRVFPKTGILLKGELQKVTVMGKNGEFGELDLGLILQIRFNFQNNFNRIHLRNHPALAQKYGQLSQYSGVKNITVEIGTDHLRVLSQIEKEILISSSLGKETASISMIQSKVRDQDEYDDAVCEFVTELTQTSKFKSMCQPQTTPVSIPIQQPYPHNQLQIQQAPLPTYPQQMHSARSIQFSRIQTAPASSGKLLPVSSHYMSMNKQPVNTLELLILTIAAGLFFSFGANFKYFLYALF